MKDLTLIFKPILFISETLFHVLVFLKKLSISTFFKTVLVLSGAVLFHPTPLSAAANSCPGDVITGDVSGHLTAGILGLILANTDDYYRYYPGSGSLTIEYDSVEKTRFYVGSSCESDDILSVENQKSGTVTITLGVTDTIYIHVQRKPYDIFSGGGDTDYSITLDFTPSPLEIVENADDLCYENPSEGGLLCIEGLLGIVDVGLLCKESINIRNQGGEPLTDVQAVFGFVDLLNVDALSDCGVDNVSGSDGLLGGALNGLLNKTLNGLVGGVLGGLLGGLGDIINGLIGVDLGTPLKDLLGILTGTNQTCGVDTLVNLGPLAGVGLFDSREWFNLPDYDANDTHSIYHVPLLNAALFSNDNTDLYGTYIKNGKRYRGPIPECSALIAPVTGSFDAWDTFRGDTDGDGKFDDKNISTKIVGKPFSLTIANLNSSGTQLETKGGTSIQVTYGLYSQDNSTPIEGTSHTFDANTTSSLTQQFTVPLAAQEVHVGFRFCASYDGAIHTLANDESCEGTSLVGCDVNSTQPTWRLCHSSDGFAIRPDRFSLVPPEGEDLGLLRSGEQYPFAIYANPSDESDTEGTEAYDQTKDNLDLNTTILLSDGSTDSEDLLHGNLFFGESDFTFDNGISRNASNQSNHVADIGFDDVGDVIITLQDRAWAAIDSDDTPQNCEGNTFTNAATGETTLLDGAYICGDRNATFIPAYFDISGITLRNHRDGNFTYLSNDLNMSAHLDVQISAMNAQGAVTQNFREGALFYENPVSVDLNVTDWNASLPNRHPLGNTVIIKDINVSKLGFGGDDEANGTHTIAWNDSNLTQRLMFNYERDNNQPVNPFNVPESDINITVASLYTSEVTGATRTVTGTGVEKDDLNATFYYGRAKASQDFYDVEGTVVNTPITVQVYCDTFPTCPIFPDTIQLGGQTDLSHWWLSLYHNEASGDGEITLQDPVAVLGSGSGSVTTDVNITNGQDTNVTVTHNSGSLPTTYDILLDTSHTDSWLIYNAGSSIADPDPFYKVRFTGDSGWAGVGKTGHVLDINASATETKRLNW